MMMKKKACTIFFSLFSLSFSMLGEKEREKERKMHKLLLFEKGKERRKKKEEAHA